MLDTDVALVVSESHEQYQPRLPTGMNSMNANMAGFNAGNAALGNIPMVNNVPNGAMRLPEEQVDETPNYEGKLNSLIYQYFCTKGEYDSARAVKNSHMVFDPPLNAGDVNGMDDPMQTDSKDGIDKNRPDDLPDVKGIMHDGQGGSFLLGWFCLFWDIYFAQRKKPQASHNAMQYVQHTTVSPPSALSFNSLADPLITATSEAAPGSAAANVPGHAYGSNAAEHATYDAISGYAG